MGGNDQFLSGVGQTHDRRLAYEQGAWRRRARGAVHDWQRPPRRVRLEDARPLQRRKRRQAEGAGCDRGLHLG